MLRFGRISLFLVLIALWGFVNSCTEKSTDSEEPTRPAAPSNLAAAAIDTVSISLSWQDNSNNEEGFQVYRWNGVQWGSIRTTNANITHDTVAGLWPGTEYSFRVKAFNNTGESDFSNSAVVSTDERQIPSAPEDLTLQPLDYKRIFISWTDNSDNETGFNLQRHEQGRPFVTIAELPANDTSYSDNFLSSQTLYYYRVGAIGQDGTSWTEEDTARTWPFAVPQAPSHLGAVSVMEVGVSLTWQDNTPYENYFVIRRSDEGAGYVSVSTLGVNVEGYLDQSVFEAHQYSYFVTAVNTVGESDSSNVVSVYYGYSSKGAIPLAKHNYWLYDISETGGGHSTYREKVLRVDVINHVPWFFMHKENYGTGDVDTSTYLRNEDSDLIRGVVYWELGNGELLWKYPATVEDFYFVESDCVSVTGTDVDVVIPIGTFEECYAYRRFSDGGIATETFIKPLIGILRVRVYDGLDLLSEQILTEYQLYGPQ
ncbi:fibronectin type III domain-containing protein [bacterium]|nr:fibronectin type III domain-containing protein [bacterium]